MKHLNKTTQCPACGESFKNHGSYRNHCRYSKACTHEARFWARVNKNGPNGCWVWMGYCQRFGHGWLGSERGLAHRFAWELLNGPLPDDKCLLHRCDNPPCVNPEHLFLGDRAANLADSVAKNRHAWGERSQHAKLTAEQVLDIRRSFRKDGNSRQSPSNAKELAEKYGVKVLTINAIIAGRSWQRLS